MTAQATVTVRLTEYTVEAEEDPGTGQAVLWLYNQLGGSAGCVLSDPASAQVPPAALVVGGPSWWTIAENAQAARDAIAAAQQLAEQIEQSPELADDPEARYQLTLVGAASLAADEALQIRMDTVALDEIASLLRHTGAATPERLLALIAEQVAATRRTVRAARTG